jgi:hypothetical protein
MNKTIIIESMQTPDQPGYLDTLGITEGPDLLYHGPCSTCPNPYRPSDNMPWPKCYAWVAPTPSGQLIDWRCWESPKHGKCLILNGGDAVRTRYPNMNHAGNYQAFNIEIHMGYARDWRGSAGCITYPPDIADVVEFFEIGETGQLEIIDYNNMRGKRV